MHELQYCTFYHFHPTWRFAMSSMAHNPDRILLVQPTIKGLYKGPIITCQSRVTCQKRKHISTVNINLPTASNLLQNKWNSITQQFVNLFSLVHFQFLFPQCHGLCYSTCFNSTDQWHSWETFYRITSKLENLKLKSNTSENIFHQRSTSLLIYPIELQECEFKTSRSL